MSEDNHNPVLRSLEVLHHSLQSLIGVLYRLNTNDSFSARRRTDPKRLLFYGFQAFSQNDEDGIIQEIFSRIGTRSKTFVELGCGNGLENNTAYLLLSGWSGVWIDSDKHQIDSARDQFEWFIRAGRLDIYEALVDRLNVNSLVASSANDVDLLSIDIDGNDYWVWEALESISPRVVAIEYNPTFRPPVAVVVPYSPTFVWNNTTYYGASLKALERLAGRKGYMLVGCNITGVNAFFVRKDLVNDNFCEPLSAENHYEGPTYYHRRDVGPYDIIS